MNAGFVDFLSYLKVSLGTTDEFVSFANSTAKAV